MQLGVRNGAGIDTSKYMDLKYGYVKCNPIISLAKAIKHGETFMVFGAFQDTSAPLLFCLQHRGPHLSFSGSITAT